MTEKRLVVIGSQYFQNKKLITRTLESLHFGFDPVMVHDDSEAGKLAAEVWKDFSRESQTINEAWPGDNSRPFLDGVYWLKPWIVKRCICFSDCGANVPNLACDFINAGIDTWFKFERRWEGDSK